MALRLNLALIVVEDFASMRAFYRDVLGLAEQASDPGPPYWVGIDWAQFRSGDGFTIELFDHHVFGRSQSFPYPRRNAVELAFQVDDLEARAAALRGRGVEVGEVVREAWGGAIHIQDPEGNLLQFYQTSDRA